MQKKTLHKISLRNSASYASDFLRLQLSDDVCDMTGYSITGNRYLITFTDD